MANFWVPERIDQPELMDQPGVPVAEVAEAYAVLRRVNRQLGNLAAIRREVRRFLREDRASGSPRRILDLGSGSGDIPRAIQEFATTQDPLLVVALDRDPTAVGAATQQGVPSLRADALRLPLADQSVDLVTAVKFAHHFSGQGLQRLLSEMTRVAQHRVVVLDIRRHRLAHWGFRLWSQVFTTNRLVRYDGPLSVLRGFTADELLAEGRALDGFDWQVRAYPGFQLALVGRRRSSTHAEGSAGTAV